MKKAVAVASVFMVILVLRSNLSNADDGNPNGFYAGVDLGLDVYEDDGDTELEEGLLLGANLGYRWNNGIRTEVELSGSKADADDGDELSEIWYLRSTLGIYYDILPTGRFIVPYAGAGIGYAAIFVDDEDGDQDDGQSLSLHGEGGFAININNHLALVPAYRLTWIEDNSVSLDDDLLIHAFKIGARLSF